MLLLEKDNMLIDCEQVTTYVPGISGKTIRYNISLQINGKIKRTSWNVYLKKVNNETTGGYEFEDFNYATLPFNILRDLGYNIENEREIIEKSFTVCED